MIHHKKAFCHVLHYDYAQLTKYYVHCRVLYFSTLSIHVLYEPLFVSPRFSLLILFRCSPKTSSVVPYIHGYKDWCEGFLPLWRFPLVHGYKRFMGWHGPASGLATYYVACDERINCFGMCDIGKSGLELVQGACRHLDVSYKLFGVGDRILEESI
jgi:hypothetical protein